MQVTDTSTSRFQLLDLLRAVAAQLIVLHHLSAHCPLSDLADEATPQLLSALFEHGRLSVQVFLVIGGLIAARSLERSPPVGPRGIGATLWHRWRRLAPPYLATLAVAVLANALARSLFSHETISGPATLPQMLAHVFFMQDILGFEALTTGIWYIAIDFQLTLLTAVVFALSARLARVLPASWEAPPMRVAQVAQVALAALAAGSLFWFNRLGHLDVWGVYFFGTFFLGMALHWTLSRQIPELAFWGYALLTLGAAIADWRLRLLVALSTAVLIRVAGARASLKAWPRSAVVEWFAQRSYSLFLIHFPVSLVIHAAVAQWMAPSANQAFATLVVSWVLSNVAAAAFYSGVEVRLKRLTGERFQPLKVATVQEPQA